MYVPNSQARVASLNLAYYITLQIRIRYNPRHKLIPLLLLTRISYSEDSQQEKLLKTGPSNPTCFMDRKNKEDT